MVDKCENDRNLICYVHTAYLTCYSDLPTWLVGLTCYPDSLQWIPSLTLHHELPSWLTTMNCYPDFLPYLANLTCHCYLQLMIWHVILPCYSGYCDLLPSLVTLTCFPTWLAALTCHPDLLFWPTSMNFLTRVDVLAHWSDLSPWSASLSYLLTWLAIQTNSGTNYPHLLPIQCTCSSNFLSWLATLTCHPFCYVAL